MHCKCNNVCNTALSHLSMDHRGARGRQDRKPNAKLDDEWLPQFIKVVKGKEGRTTVVIILKIMSAMYQS